jgi:hypothetical protein
LQWKLDLMLKVRDHPSLLQQGQFLVAFTLALRVELYSVVDDFLVAVFARFLCSQSRACWKMS